MPAAMPCKIPIKSCVETQRSIGKRKTKYACVVDADESTRPRLEGAGRKPHQDHVAVEGTNSITHFLLSLHVSWKPVNPQECVWRNLYRIIMRTILQEKGTFHYNITIWYTSLFRCLKLSKFQMQRRQWSNFWKNWRKIPAWQLTKVRNKKEVIEEARNKGRKVRFASLMDLCHLQNSELELQYQKYEGRVVLRGDNVKDDSRQNHGYHLQIARVLRTSSWRSIRVHPGHNGRYSTNYWKFQNRSVQTFGFVYHDANGLNHGLIWKTQSFPSNEICAVILWQDHYGKGNLRKFCLEHCWEKVLNWECLYCTPWKCNILVSVCGRCQTGRQHRKHRTDLENSHERRWSGKTNIISWPCIFGLHLKTVWNK